MLARPIFEDQFSALKDLTSGAVSIRDIGDDKRVYRDHMSFEQVGLPAFRFLQDPLDFEFTARQSRHGAFPFRTRG
jgi:hypothetical protein